MPNKLTFDCQYSVQSRTLVITPHDSFGVSIVCKFEEDDQWVMIFWDTKAYDVHLLRDSEDYYSVEIYIMYKVDGEYASSYEARHQQFVNLSVFNSADFTGVNLLMDAAGEEQDEADCIASGYEFSCVHCHYTNKIYEWTSPRFCTACGQVNVLKPPVDAMGG